jgi:cell division control protein 6
MGNIEAKKSGLLYLCGHPGTGKTSTLNLVLQEMKQNVKTNLLNPIEIFIHNAMTYNDVKTYGIQILKEISERNGVTKLKVNRSIDEEELSNMIAKALRVNFNTHKIIVIDEIDTFQSQDKAFIELIKSILKTATNTTIVGIANSVDLPFKKKYSAIAMRDA